MARRAAPVTSPRPAAPACLGSTAIDISALPARTGGTNGAALTAVDPRSASRNSSSRGGSSGASRMATTEAPVSMAEALPRSTEWRTTTAPASRARCWVSSSLPSSTTRTMSTCGIARTARTVAAIRSPSSLAGTMAATRSFSGSCRGTGMGPVSGVRRRITRSGLRPPSPCSRLTSSPYRLSAQCDLPGHDACPRSALVRGQRSGLGRGLLQTLGERRGNVLQFLGLGARGEFPHRDHQTTGAESTDELRPLIQGRGACRTQPREPVEQGLLLFGARPAQELLIAHPAPVGAGDRLELDRGHDRSGELFQGGFELRIGIGALGQDEVESLVQGDLEGPVRLEHVLQPGALTGKVEVIQAGAGLGVEHLLQGECR